MVAHGDYPKRDEYQPHIPLALKRIANRAMNPDRSKRYQSADALRHALEGVAINCDWELSATTWAATVGNAEVRVSLTADGGRRNIETTKTGPSGKPRRVTDACHLGLEPANAEKVVGGILQDYVAGRRS